MEPWEGATPDLTDPGLVALYDELPLWPAPFGQVLREEVELRTRPGSGGFPRECFGRGRNHLPTSMPRLLPPAP